MCRVVFNPLSELPDIGPEVLHVVSELHSPNSTQNLFVSNWPTLVRHKQVEDVELCAREGNLHSPLEEESPLCT